MRDEAEEEMLEIERLQEECERQRRLDGPPGAAVAVICYLDSNLVMYYVERPLRWGPAAQMRIARLLSEGYSLAVNDLTRMECRVRPLRACKRITW